MLSNALFVYGTLMSEQSRHHLLAPGGIVSIESASTAGTLFHLGDYPGLHLSGDGSSRVLGEYIQFHNLDYWLLAALDKEEGNEYSRQLVTVQRSNGANAIAWTYIFTGAANQRVISSGDWRHG